MMNLVKTSCFVALCSMAVGVSHASVVSTIDPAGGLTVDTQVGSASMASIQALITARNDTSAAGVLNAEGFTIGGSLFGGFSGDPDYASLDITITGATRYGRSDGSHATSGTQFGYVSGTETWTLGGVGVTHFGFTHRNLSSSYNLTVTVTYSDASTEMASSTATGVYFFGFTKPGQTITSVKLTEPAGGVFTPYDDVAFVTVPEPGTLGMAALASLLGLCRPRRRCAQ